MRTINVPALVLRGDSILDPEKPDEQVIALLLESGALRDERPVVKATPAVTGFQTLVVLLSAVPESDPVRVRLEAEAPKRKALSDCVTSDIVVKTIYAI